MLTVQPIADTGGGATGPAGALLSLRLCGPHRHQPFQPGGRVHLQTARQAAVDHHPHPVDGQRGLGNIGGQHHPALGAGQDGPLLLLKGQIAVQRADHHPRHPFQFPLHRPDLAATRQKGQQIALLFRQGLPDRAGHPPG